MRRLYRLAPALPRTPALRAPALLAARHLTGAGPLIAQYKLLIAAPEPTPAGSGPTPAGSGPTPPGSGPTPQTVLYNLLASANLSAATTLAHTLAARGPLVLADQLWSFYALQACAHAHYPAACLVYHHLIAGSEPSAHVEHNHHPFLLSHETLAALAAVFVHHADAVKVHGLLAYFKRYYSSLGHQQTYRDLRCSLVEAHSAAGDLGRALTEFARLHFVFARATGHANARRSMEHVFTNYRRRRAMTRANVGADAPETEFDAAEAAAARTVAAQPFRPSQERNIYTLPGRRYYSIVNDAMVVADLPYFHRLVDANVQALMADATAEKLDTLVRFVELAQPTLHMFVVRSLCDLGHVLQAWSLLVRLRELAPIEADAYASLLAALPQHPDAVRISADLMRLQTVDTLRWKLALQLGRIVALFLRVVLGAAAPPDAAATLAPVLRQLEPRDRVRLDPATYAAFRRVFPHGYPIECT